MRTWGTRYVFRGFVRRGVRKGHCRGLRSAGLTHLGKGEECPVEFCYFPHLAKSRPDMGHPPRWLVILPVENVSLSEAVLMRKGVANDEVKAGTLYA